MNGIVDKSPSRAALAALARLKDFELQADQSEGLTEDESERKFIQRYFEIERSDLSRHHFEQMLTANKSDDRSTDALRDIALACAIDSFRANMRGDISDAWMAANRCTFFSMLLFGMYVGAMALDDFRGDTSSIGLSSGLADILAQKATAMDEAAALAKRLWEDDERQSIRIGEMADLVYRSLANDHLDALPETVERVKDWIKDVAPTYARKPGRSRSKR